MYTVPNQRVIKTHKEKCGKDDKKYYTVINLKALAEAANNLSGSAFKMWIYLAKNQNNYKFALSKVDATSFCDFSKNTYYSAFAELEEKGYLIQGNCATYYDFYEVTKKKKEDKKNKEGQ